MRWIVTFLILGTILIEITGCNKTSKSKIDLSEIDKSIEEFKNRKIYTKIDFATLKSIPDDKLEQAVKDYICFKFNKDWSNEFDVITSLSPGLRAVYSTSLLEDEVNNGGFNQFYWNSSGQFAKESEDGLALIGAKEHLELMREANKIHEQEKPVFEKYKKIGTSEAFSKSYGATKLNTLDDKFYKMKESLSELRIKYIRTHPKEFISE